MAAVYSDPVAVEIVLEVVVITDQGDPAKVVCQVVRERAAIARASPVKAIVRGDPAKATDLDDRGKATDLEGPATTRVQIVLAKVAAANVGDLVIGLTTDLIEFRIVIDGTIGELITAPTSGTIGATIGTTTGTTAITGGTTIGGTTITGTTRTIPISITGDGPLGQR